MPGIARSAATFFIAFALQAQLSAVALEGTQSETGSPARVLNENSYIIGPGDILDLKLYSSQDLSGQFEVMADGTIPLPLIGTVQVSGLSLQQATSWLQDLFSQELIQPYLQLIVKRPRPLQISIIGQVQRPGLYVLSPGSSPGSNSQGVSGASGGLPTLVSAIQSAGGITQNANIREVRLQRRLPGLNPRYKLANFNLYDLLFRGNQAQNPFLFDGDVIEISLAEETPQEAIELASVNLSPKTISVNMVGEINSPGLLSIKANTPLSQAVMMAGGSKEWRANRGNVELIRLNRDGSVTSRSFRLNLEASASNSSNPPLRDGDIVRVRRNILAKGSDVVDGVSRPLTGLVTLWSLVKLVSNTSN